jgi:hypothetical protein
MVQRIRTALIQYFQHEVIQGLNRNLLPAFMLVGCVIGLGAVIAGLIETERLISSTKDLLEIKQPLPNSGFSTNTYTLAQKYLYWVVGVKFQAWIAIGLVIQCFSCLAIRCLSRELSKKVIWLILSKLGLALTTMAWVWYSLFSYQVLYIEQSCTECPLSRQFLVGASPLWALLITTVVFVNLIFGIAQTLHLFSMFFKPKSVETAKL